MIQLKVLLVFAFCVQNIYCLCENYDALNNVTADVKLDRRSKSGKYFGHMNQLDQYVVIDVYQGNITDLCEGMVKNFIRLEVLNLINVNISKIQRNAFQELPRLTELSLAVNHLTELVDGGFNNLGSLEKLYLSGNQIKTISSDAFQGLNNLRQLHLDRNQLTKLEGNIFKHLPLLQILDLKFNFFDKIDKTTFCNLELSYVGPVAIYLINNNIRDVDPDVLDFPNPVNLHLERNNLNTISTLFHGVKDYSTIYLDFNQFNCLPDDVLENMKNTTKSIYLRNNPIACECLDQFDSTLGEYQVFGVGNLYYSTIFPCDFPQFLNP